MHLVFFGLVEISFLSGIFFFFVDLFIYKIVEAEMKCKSLVSLEIFQGSLQERADLHAAAAPVHFSDLHAALYSGGEEKFNNKYNGRLIFMYRISNQTPGSKVYKNKILYSVYSKCRENICFHLFFFPRQQYRYF